MSILYHCRNSVLSQSSWFCCGANSSGVSALHPRKDETDRTKHASYYSSTAGKGRSLHSLEAFQTHAQHTAFQPLGRADCRSQAVLSYHSSRHETKTFTPGNLRKSLKSGTTLAATGHAASWRSALPPPWQLWFCVWLLCSYRTMQMCLQ